MTFFKQEKKKFPIGISLLQAEKLDNFIHLFYFLFFSSVDANCLTHQLFIKHFGAMNESNGCEFVCFVGVVAFFLYYVGIFPHS